MLFSSIAFIYFFLPISLLVYFITPSKYKNLSLLLISLVFFYLSDVRYFYIVFYISFLAYIFGRLLEKKRSTYILILGLILQLMVLLYFKYFTILVEFFGLDFSVDRMILPLGISFYTFKSLSYTVDIYREKYKSEKNPIDFLLYMTYYPSLVSGPIIRFDDFKPYLNSKDISSNNIYYGIKRFILGLGKKVILANNLEKLMEYGHLENSSLMSWLMVISFSLQLYFDFSGYSDMALGLSSIMGIKLRENFNYPFSAKSLADFWRRWHISLGSWFRDYIYIPLGGNRVSRPRWAFNILLVWTLTGLWHGSSSNYIFWGLFIFMGLIVEKILEGRGLDRFSNFSRNLLTCSFILISFNFFYSKNMTEAWLNLRNIFFIGQVPKWGPISSYQVKNNILLLGLSLILSREFLIKLIEKCRKNTIFDMTYSFLLFLILLLILYVSTMIMVNDSFNPFLYIKF